MKADLSFGFLPWPALYFKSLAIDCLCLSFLISSRSSRSFEVGFPLPFLGPPRPFFLGIFLENTVQKYFY